MGKGDAYDLGFRIVPTSAKGFLLLPLLYIGFPWKLVFMFEEQISQQGEK